MARWITFMTTVVFAVSACESNPPESAEATEQQKHQQGSLESSETDFQSHNTATGLSFKAPSNWNVEMMPAGARLSPPDTSKLREKYLLVIRFAPDETGDATDGDYIDSLADDFSSHIDDSEIATRRDDVDSPMGSGAYIGWNVAESDWTKRVGFFVVIDKPWMLVLRQVGPLERVDQRRETLEQIFATTELTDAETDQQLVGTWHRARPIETEKGDFHEKMTLEADGTLRLTHQPAAGSDSRDTLEDVGRWAVREDGFVRYFGNQLTGSIQMNTTPWSLKDDGRLLEIEAGGSTTRWERLD